MSLLDKQPSYLIQRHETIAFRIVGHRSICVVSGFCLSAEGIFHHIDDSGMLVCTLFRFQQQQATF